MSNFRSSPTNDDLLAKTDEYINEGLHLLNQEYFSKAEPLFLQALDIQEQILGLNHPDVGDSLSYLAYLYRNQDHRINEAEPLLLRALSIAEHEIGPNHSNIVYSINNLAFFYQDQGRFKEAEGLLLRALSIVEPNLRQFHFPVVESLNNLAVLYHDQGRDDEAETLLLRALSIAERSIDRNGSSLSLSLDNLAILYNDQGRISGTEAVMKRALLIRVWYAGDIWRDKNSFMSGYFAYNRIYDGATTTPDIGFRIYSLALLYRENGLTIESEALTQWALTILEKVYGLNHPDVSECLTNLAINLAANDKHAEAYDNISLALHERLRRIGLEFANRSVTSRIRFSSEYQAELFKYYNLALRQVDSKPEIAAEILNIVLKSKHTLNTALVAERQAVLSGRYPNLAEIFEKRRALAIRFNEMNLRSHLIYKSRSDYNKQHSEMKAELVELELALARSIPEIKLEQLQDKLTLESLINVLPENAILIEFVKYHRYDFTAIKARNEEPWREWRYMALLIIKNTPGFVRLVDLGNAEDIDNDIQSFQVCLKNSILPSCYQASGSGSNLSDDSFDNEGCSRNFSEAGLRLRKQLIDAFRLEQAPAIEADQEKPLLIIAADGELTRLAFGALPMEAPSTYLLDYYQLHYVDSGRDLITLPATNDRVGSPPLLLADPDFDFKVPDTEFLHNGEKLINATDVYFSNIFPESKRQWRQSRDLDTKSLNFSRLPGTRIEAELIADQLRARLWLDKDALKGKLKRNTSSIILHIATHGFFFPNQQIDQEVLWGISLKPTKLNEHLSKLENPLLRSGLALAGANHALNVFNSLDLDTEDGLLTAADVAEMDMLDTELVVLSACQSGLGDVEIGQGVSGLRSAFKVAGVKTLVISLWPVNDLATCILMSRFYDNLIQKCLPRNEALTNAMQYLRYLKIGEMKTTWLTQQLRERFVTVNPTFAVWFDQLASMPLETQPFLSPYYWAAFILIGNINPLPKNLTN